MAPISRTFSVLIACAIAISAVVLGGCARVENLPDRPGLVYPPSPDQPRIIYERTIYGTADVTKATISRFRQLITGENRVLDVGLEKPYGLSVYRGRIYVSDTALNAVLVLDVPNGQAWELGAGLLMKPLGIDVDASGNVYVCDAAVKAVYVFDPTGRVIKKIGAKGDFDRPAGVAVNRDGSKVYVVDVGGVDSQNHRVRVYDGETSEHLYDIGTRGREPGNFNLPRDARVARDGTIYVVDGGNFRIQVFDKDGELLKVFGSIGRQSGQFARPKGIALDSEGRIYVSDAAFGNFQLFTNEGQLLLAIGSRSASETAAHYMLPAGVAVDEDGRIYIADQFFKKIDIFRPADLPARRGYLINSVDAVNESQ